MRAAFFALFSLVLLLVFSLFFHFSFRCFQAPCLAAVSGGHCARAFLSIILSSHPQLLTGIGGYDLTTVGCIAAVVLAAVAASAPSAARDPPGGPPAGPALPSVYDSNTVTAYWNARPLQVASRAATVGREVASFLVALARDKVQGTELLRDACG